MNGSIYGVIVAGIAVVVSGIMQYLTLKMSRHNTMTGLRVVATESVLLALRNTISEYIPVIYKIKVHELDKLTEGPGLSGAEVDKLAADEAKMFGLIQMSLDPTKPAHARLMVAITEIREKAYPEGGSWTDKRDNVFTGMRDLSHNEREEALGVETLNVVNFGLLYSFAHKAKDQVYERINRVVVLLNAKAKKLRQ